MSRRLSARGVIAIPLIMALVFIAYPLHKTLAAGCTNVALGSTNLTNAVTAASSGDMLCLANGDYGRWLGTTKAITITAQPGAAVSLNIDSRGSNNLSSLTGFTIDGTLGGGTMTIGLDLRGSTTTARNLTFKNLIFANSTDQGDMVYIDGPTNTNIMFDNDTFNNGDCDNGDGARFHVAYPSLQPTGITVQNSTFDGGSADGIQAGSTMTILNNRFNNIVEGEDTDCHTDPIQIYCGCSDGGIGGSTIRNNYITNSSTGIAAYDGTHDQLIENNILDNITANEAIILGGDDRSIVRHNTIRGNAHGRIDLTSKAAFPNGSNDEDINNNLTVHNLSVTTSGQTTCNCTAVPARNINNLMTGETATGDNIDGTPVFAGGSTFTTPANYAIVSGAGKNAGTDDDDEPDGSDIGANVAMVGPNNGSGVLLGDLDDDGDVDDDDLDILLPGYGTTTSAGDINANGKVNLIDISILLRNYGQ